MLSMDKILRDQKEYLVDLQREIKETFVQEIEDDIQEGRYEEASDKVAEKLELGISIEYLRFGYHFEDDNSRRDIYKITFKKDGNYYSFDFGQSLVKTMEKIEPTNYDVLACITKYDPEDFDSFCDNFGYDKEAEEEENTASWAKNLGSQRVYNAVVKEWDNLNRLFSEDDFDLLKEIN